MEVKIKFNKINHIILFGGSRLTAEIAQHILKDRLYSFSIYTCDRQLNDAIYDGETLGDFLKDRNINYTSTDDINTAPGLLSEITENSFGLGLGEAWSFSKEIIEALKVKFPEIKHPIKEDICYATTNRQEVVKKIAPMCDMFFVVGSKNSSNSQRLVEVAKKSGCIKSKLIPFNENLPIDSIIKCNKIGITSGASAPEQLVQDLILELKKYCKVSIEEIVFTKENVTFKLPKLLN